MKQLYMSLGLAAAATALVFWGVSMGKHSERREQLKRENARLAEYQSQLHEAAEARAELEESLRAATAELQFALAGRNEAREENAREPVVITRVVETQSECFYPDVVRFVGVWNADAVGASAVPVAVETGGFRLPNGHEITSTL